MHSKYQFVLLFLSISEDYRCSKRNGTGGLKCNSAGNHKRFPFIVISATGLNRLSIWKRHFQYRLQTTIFKLHLGDFKIQYGRPGEKKEDCLPSGYLVSPVRWVSLSENYQKNKYIIEVLMFSAAKVVIQDTIFTSPPGEGTAILRIYPSHAKV